MKRLKNILLELKEKLKKAGWKKILLAAVRAAVYIHLFIFFTTLFFCLLYAFVNPPYTSLMLYRQVFYRHQVQSPVFVPLSSIPWTVKKLTVDAEDNTFYRHWGIEPHAIKDALRRNLRAGYYRYGGSTITQQLARTLFLVPKKWLVRKYVEALIAVEMDLFLSKDRLLELYLNTIEWGKGIYGIGRASLYYYGKPVASLSTEEIASLLAVIPAPLNYTPFSFRNNKALTERYYFLLNRAGDQIGTNRDGTAEGTNANTNAREQDATNTVQTNTPSVPDSATNHLEELSTGEEL